jgi:hypothetical protein
MTKSKIVHPKKAEEDARSILQWEFRQKFSSNKLKGRKFDLVSQDRKIVAQVKSSQKKFEELKEYRSRIETRFERYLIDCVLLEKVKARNRIFS